MIVNYELLQKQKLEEILLAIKKLKKLIKDEVPWYYSLKYTQYKALLWIVILSE